MALARALEDDADVTGLRRGCRHRRRRLPGYRRSDPAHSAPPGSATRRFPKPCHRRHVAVGAGASGLAKPVAEIQFMGFLYSAIDHLANHASRLQQPHPGAADLPDGPARALWRRHQGARSTIRKAPRPCSPISPACAWSIPSAPARAYGLLLAAIRDPDPVVFLEPKRLYRAVSETVQDDGLALPLDKAHFVLRRHRRHTCQLGRDAEGNPEGSDRPRRDRHRRRGHRSTLRSP